MFNPRGDRLAAPRSLSRRALTALALVVIVAGRYQALAQAATRAEIASPSADQVLTGTVEITGIASSGEFASAELDFGYASDTSGTWFVIEVLDQPVENGVIARWNTLAISDGDYVLRLRVSALDGTFGEARVNVHVRNYSAPPTPNRTPSPTATPPLEIPSPRILIPTQTPQPAAQATPTAFSPNPAASSAGEIYSGFWRGALVVVGLFVLGVLLLVRRRS